MTRAQARLQGSFLTKVLELAILTRARSGKTPESRSAMQRVIREMIEDHQHKKLTGREVLKLNARINGSLSALRRRGCIDVEGDELRWIEGEVRTEIRHSIDALKGP